MLRFYKFSLLKRSPFHLDTIFNFVAIREFKVCLSVCLNVCLGYKSNKNWSILMKFGYAFAVSDFILCTKNCDCTLYTFYRDTPKPWIFASIYIPLWISLCDIINKCHNKNGFYYSFLTTCSLKIWCRDTRERVSEESSKQFFL